MDDNAGFDLESANIELGPEIGRGGMGIVYRGHHRVLERSVAVKFIYPHLVGDPVAIKRFRQEMKHGATLHHPNIVQVHGASVTETGEPYMIMEFVEGKTLAASLSESENGRLETGQVISIFEQILDAVQYMHEQGVVHRDLKPSNIILSFDERGQLLPKIADFGIARFLRSDMRQTLTQQEGLIGSPAYMSPEQCQGQSGDHRSDVYTIGAVMYECLTGQQLFDGATGVDIMRQHVESTAPTLTLPAVDKAHSYLNDILQKALQKDPQERFSSAATFGDALRSRGRGVQVTKKHRHRKWLKPLAASAGAIALTLIGLKFLALQDSRLIAPDETKPPEEEKKTQIENEPKFESYSYQSIRGRNEQAYREGKFERGYELIQQAIELAKQQKVSDNEIGAMYFTVARYELMFKKQKEARESYNTAYRLYKPKVFYDPLYADIVSDLADCE